MSLLSLFLGFLKKEKKSCPNCPKHKPGPLSRRPLHLELLEERALLSATQEIQLDWFATFENPATEAVQLSDLGKSGEIPHEWIIRLSEQALQTLSTPSLAKEYLAEQGIDVVAGLGMKGYLQVYIAANDTTVQENLLGSLDIVASFQPNYYIETAGVADVVNDPLAESLWGHDKINVQGAWDFTQGSQDVIVAVIDSGVNFNHPDLIVSPWTNPGEIPDDGIDNDDNGLIDDYYGWNFVDFNNDISDTFNHGTCIAGIIAATANNDTGVVGVSPEVLIMAVKIIDAQGRYSSSAVSASAINYVTYMKMCGNNIVAINVSYGGNQFYSEVEYTAIMAAYGMDILVVTAAMNNGENIDGLGIYPSNYNAPNLITVANSTQDDTLYRSSNYGVEVVDLAAPGTSILCCTANGDYTNKNGTSFAVPYVTATAALIASMRPDYSVTAIKEAILNSVDTVDALADKVATGGRLNAEKALIYASTPRDFQLAFEAGNSVTLTWEAVTDQTYYLVQKYTGGDPADEANWTTISPELTGNSFKVAGMTRGVEYQFRVIAVKPSTPTFHSKATESVFVTLSEVILPEAPSIVVTTLDDVVDAYDEKISLREAILYAGTNGLGTTITFAANLSGGTILLNGEQLEITKGLVISAANLENGITINADQKSRVFYITGSNVTLVGLTITGGYIMGELFEGAGGGIYNSGRLTVTDCTISGNAADWNGSGMGGGIGGGIFNLVFATLTVMNSTISGNSADWGGGGIYNFSGTVTVTNSTISDNWAVDGGGISNFDGELTLTNSTISGNFGVDGGGISSTSSATLTITNCTISDNNGAGICQFNSTPSGTLTLYNTIVAKNGYSDIIFYGTIQGSNNLIGNGTRPTAFVNGVDGNIVGTAENPIDPMIAEPIRQEDGSWIYGALLPGSPAINAGNNDYVRGDTDVLGQERIQNGTVNIGAIEGLILEPRPGVTYYVTSLEDAIGLEGVLTFREAFEAANGNIAVGNAPAGSYSEKDTIIFAPGLAGTIFLDGREIEIIGSLDIIGSGAESLIFDAGGKSGVFKIGGGVDVELSGITITGGLATIFGGGIFNFGNLTVTDCTISGNTAYSGGGIYNYGGTLTLTNSTISGNSAADWGGIYGDVVGSKQGGGIYSYGGTLTVTNCTISGNSADEGGGIYSLGANSTLTVSNCTISGNTAWESGGGIYSSWNGTLTITNSMIAGNTADEGGGIYNRGQATVTNSTISGNSADEGGGINNNGGYATLNLYNTIVAKNTDSDIVRVLDYSGYPGIINGYNNLTTFDGWDNGPGDNFLYDPELPLFVDAENGDYRLAEGSQAIDKGDNAYVPEGVTTDLAGNPRIVGGTVDIGAYEYQETGPGPILETPSIVVTTLDDVVDAYDGKISLREAILYAGTNGLGTTITFDPALFADGEMHTITLSTLYRPLVITSGVTIVGPGADLLSISSAEQMRVFYIATSFEEVSISGLTIRDGYAHLAGYGGVGAGIYATNTTLNLDDVAFINNSATYGGAICTYYTDLNITNAIFEGNTAETEGGAIWHYGSTNKVTGKEFSITETEFVNNTAKIFGGAIYLKSTPVNVTTIDSSTFASNSAVYGGALYQISGNLAITGNTKFTANKGLTIEGRGGAIYSAGGDFVVSDSIFDSNTATYGAGIWRNGWAVDVVTLTNVTFDNNAATRFAGAIYCSVHSKDTIVITDSQFTNNTAGTHGGAIYASSGTFDVSNSVFTGNNAPQAKLTVRLADATFVIDGKVFDEALNDYFNDPSEWL